MRIAACLLFAAAVLPATADAREAPYYGPMKAWHGIGYKFGYKDEVRPDGTWRVTASTRGGGEAVDMAMYRAAELARDAGYPYVEMLGGKGARSPGMNSAILYARPSRTPAAPATCPARRANACYTADVAEVLRRLGGEGGVQPGVPIVDHLDKYGRQVSYSGYGTGMASAAPLPATVPAPRFVPAPLPVRTAFYAPQALAPQLSQAERYERQLRAARPVNGDARLGWTATD